MDGKVIFHIDLDAFFASVEQLLDPRLRGRPVIVKGPGEHRTVVAAASYEARPFGVKAGMPVVMARRLCPKGEFVIGKAGAYADFSERVFSICRDFTPLVEPASIDEGYLDMTGTQRLHVPGSSSASWPIAAAEKLQRTIKDWTGLNCSIGIGANKVIAKIASDTAKPSGIAFIFPGYERTFLRSLPVETLPGIGEKTRQALDPFDIRRVGDLQQMPVNLLKGIFGVVGEDFHFLAMGLGGDTIETPQMPKSISRGTTFDEDTWDLGYVRRTMRELVEDLAAHARRIGLQGRLVTVRIRYRDFTTVSHCGSLTVLTNHDHEIYPKACALLTKLFNGRQPIRHVTVGLSVLTDEPRRQLDLWQPSRYEKFKSIYSAFDRIRDRHGDRAIHFAETAAGPAGD